MATYFSIGEIAKMFDISTQTLRLYDRIDLLKPIFINKETGYRYYSIYQFVKIDSIKMCKTMGLSLEEIKKLIGNDSSVQSILDFTRKQKHAIEDKIRELQNMHSHLNSFENRITDSLKTGFNKITLVENKKRYFIKYDCISKSPEELKINLRKVILNAEKNYGILNSDIGFTVSYKDFSENNTIVFKNLGIHLFNENTNINDKNIIEIPQGKYLTMYIEDSSFDNRKYYKQIIEYASKNNIEILGDFIETEIIARVNKDGKANNLAKIELLCSPTLPSYN